MEDYTKEEKNNFEVDLFGFYLLDHPVTKYKDKYTVSTTDLDKYLGKYIHIVLLVVKIKEIMTKKNDVMAFMTAEDEFTELSVTLFPVVYKENNNLKKYDIINVYGKVEKRNDTNQLVASKITKLD